MGILLPRLADLPTRSQLIPKPATARCLDGGQDRNHRNQMVVGQPSFDILLRPHAVPDALRGEHLHGLAAAQPSDRGTKEAASTHDARLKREYRQLMSRRKRLQRLDPLEIPLALSSIRDLPQLQAEPLG